MCGTDRIIKNRVGLLKLAEELGNVSKACQAMGHSLDIICRYKRRIEDGGVDKLIGRTRRKPNIKNRVDENKTHRDQLLLRRVQILYGILVCYSFTFHKHY